MTNPIEGPANNAAPGTVVDAGALLAAVDSRVKKVRTRSQDISFNELLSMYKEKDLIIRPIYQRLFRWERGKQSRFIESLILEMPVPPIFVIEDEDGRYELIDGLQRISSYLHFRGELDAPEQQIQPGTFLRLVDCDIIEALNGLTYLDLPTALDLKLKRHFTRVEVVRKESDPTLRYHMFKRLNTGGELLSDQELRNCTIRMLNSSFVDIIADLSTDPDFRTTLAYLSDERMRTLYDQELVLRFFAFKNWRKKYVHDISDFLTEYMEGVTRQDLPFDVGAERATFKKTFRILASTLGPDTFARTNDKGTFIQTFSPVHFEITAAIQPFIDGLSPDSPDDMAAVAKGLREAKVSKEFREMTTGGGLNFSKLLEQRVSFIEAKLAEAIENRGA